MSTKLNFGRDVQGYNAYAPMPSQNKFSAAITAAGNATFQLPTSAPYWIVNFSFEPGSDMWVAYGAFGVTASAPAGATFASTTSELLPAQRTLVGGSYVNIYNNGTDTMDVGAVLYAQP